jgi:ribose transport system permease protein
VGEKMIKINKNNFATYFSLSIIILLTIIFTAMERSFLDYANISNLLSDTAPLMIMAAGMTPILLLGSIDLSVGSMCSVANVMTLSIIMHFKNSDLPIWLIMLIAFVTTLVFSVTAGSILGFIHVKLKIPSFIASLAFMSIWSSVALLITNAPVSIPKKLWGTINWYKISIGPFGLSVIISIILIVFYYILLTRTSFGKGIYAIGGNERAARIAGIPVDRIKIMVFAINGFCSALGAIFLMAKAKSSAPTVGDSFTLMVISAVVLGGTSLLGGSGNILNTILGVFTVAMIKNGMNIVGVDVFWQKIVFGAIILIAIAINTDRSSRSFVVK